jgi:PhnB protein
MLRAGIGPKESRMAGKKKSASKGAARASARRTGKAKASAKAKAPAKKKVAPVPAGYHTATPYLVFRGAAEAIEFYKKAFSAKEKLRMPMPDGKVAHAEILIGNSHIMLMDEQPERGSSAPQTVGGTPVSVFLYVPNVDKVFAQAVAAGATVEMPLADMFWGDRFGTLSDPFGHKWALATHVEDLSPKEMGKRAAAAMAV